MSEASPWRIEFDPDAARELRKLGHEGRRLILRYLRERIATAENPRRFGHPLLGDLKGLWRYRVGDYRIVFDAVKTEPGLMTLFAEYNKYLLRRMSVWLDL